MDGACRSAWSWPIGVNHAVQGSVPQVPGPGRWREMMAFRFSDHSDSSRISGRIDLGLESRVGIHLEQKGLELGFGHGGMA